MALAAILLAGYLAIGLVLVAYLTIKEREWPGVSILWLAVVWPIVVVAMLVGLGGREGL